MTKLTKYECRGMMICALLGSISFGVWVESISAGFFLFFLIATASYLIPFTE